MVGYTGKKNGKRDLLEKMSKIEKKLTEDAIDDALSDYPNTCEDINEEWGA